MALGDHFREIIDRHGLVKTQVKFTYAKNKDFGDHGNNITGTNSKFRYANCSINANYINDTIDIKYSDSPTADNSSIEIPWEADKAVYGKLNYASGIIFSSGFRGCKFYLYRRNNQIYGVHASRENNAAGNPVLTKPRADIENSQGDILWKFDSRNRLPASVVGFSAVLCIMQNNMLRCFAFTYKDELKRGDPAAGGFRIVGLIEDTGEFNWNNATALAGKARKSLITAIANDDGKVPSGVSSPY